AVFVTLPLVWSYVYTPMSPCDYGSTQWAKCCRWATFRSLGTRISRPLQSKHFLFGGPTEQLKSSRRLRENWSHCVHVRNAAGYDSGTDSRVVFVLGRGSRHAPSLPWPDDFCGDALGPPRLWAVEAVRGEHRPTRGSNSGFAKSRLGRTSFRAGE